MEVGARIEIRTGDRDKQKLLKLEIGGVQVVVDKFRCCETKKIKVSVGSQDCARQVGVHPRR